MIVEDYKYNSNSKVRDKAKSRIFENPIKEEDFNKSQKARKTLMKEMPGFPNDPSSQRTDKNLLLKQNKSRNSMEKLDLSDNKKEKSKKELNRVETTGMNLNAEEEKKNGENSISSWEEDSGEEVNSEDEKKEVNKIDQNETEIPRALANGVGDLTLVGGLGIEVASYSGYAINILSKVPRFVTGGLGLVVTLGISLITGYKSSKDVEELGNQIVKLLEQEF